MPSARETALPERQLSSDHEHPSPDRGSFHPSWRARLRRYASILRTFHRDSWSSAAVYRVDFAAATLVSLFWLSSGVVGLLIFYRFVDQIAGWTFPEAMSALGLFYVLNGYRMLLIKPCLIQLADQVRMGTFDYVLLRPADSQFLTSFRRFNPASWWDIVWGLAMAVLGVVLHGRAVSLGQIGLALCCLAASLTLAYSIGVFALAAAIRIIQADSVDDLLRGLLEIGQYPVDFYGSAQARILTLVPVAFLTTVPARALLGRSSGLELVAAVCVAALALVLSRWAWQRALRTYSGASS